MDRLFFIAGSLFGFLGGESLCTELERDTGAGSDYTFWGYRLSDRMAMYGMVCLETVIA